MDDRHLGVLRDLRAIEIYVSVVETSSITRAARRLGVTPSMVSKKIAELETGARATLLHRTTRRMSVTDLGQRFYQRCLRLLDEAERAEWELRDKEREPGGRLRIAAPTVFTERQIAPLLPSFLRLYPRIELELVASARTMNLVEEGFDLSIRLVRADDVGRTGQTLAPNRRAFCAAPDYIARHGEPVHPSELQAHACLINMATQRLETWSYSEPSGAQTVRVGGPLASDNVATIVQAAEQGMGIVLAGTFVVGERLRSGTLKEILPGYVVQDSVVAAIFPARGFVPHRVALLTKFLAARFGNPPVWDRDLATPPAR